MKNNKVLIVGTIAFDEDQYGDFERSHTTEQVAYLVFGKPLAMCYSKESDRLYITEAGTNTIEVYQI